MDFIRRHKWLVTILSIIFIGLPQYIDSVWSLAEKITGRNIAMPNITWAYWITVPISIIMIGAVIWAVSSKETIKVKKQIIDRNENLTDTLTAMHRRLVELQKDRASHSKIRLRKFEQVAPILADRMGTVKLKEWPKFNKSVKKRIQQAAGPRPNFRRKFSFLEWEKYKEKVRLAGLTVALAVREELFQSKEWTLEDGVKISECEVAPILRTG